ncbi:MAG: acetyl-CoA carboxylase carboxyltransferase subunit alpha, partial [Armatimonadetes bacterium]|nr:acetyl-CoA carboxylase carboxyltransferase subunit alpha [Armatimonadota bacterium]
MANGWFRKRKGADEFPEGLWVKCDKCRELLFKREWERNLKVCMKCGHHFRLTAHERIELLLDEATFVEHDANLVSTDPLQFPGYQASLDRYRTSTELQDAAISGEGLLSGHPIGIAVTDAHFMMGSMGSVVGERFARMLERSTERGIPALLISATGGGARMHEGLLSLMQMAKTSGAIARHHAAGLFTLVLLTDPTMGGVTASWGMLGDVILAEPGAMIGFAGLRVSKQANVSKVPSDFQTAEFQQAHGQIDRVVPRRELKDTIATLLKFAGAPYEGETAAGAAAAEG